MTRIPSLLLASALAILPVAAFAQQNAAPLKSAEPTDATNVAPAVTAPGTNKTATTATNSPAQPDSKTEATGTKTDIHGMSIVHAHHAKVNVPAKTAKPARS